MNVLDTMKIMEAAEVVIDRSRHPRRYPIDDVEIKFGNHRIYQSYECDYRFDDDRNVHVTAIYKGGKCIAMPDEFYDMFAKVIQDDLP